MFAPLHYRIPLESSELYGKKIFHYTDFAGLNGILESNSIWAYRYDATRNDEDEIFTARGVLKKYIENKLPEFFKGSESEFNLNNMVHSPETLMYQNLLDTCEGVFITSFCCSEIPEVQKNGKLSFWERYGDYSIEFDYLDICNLLKQERTIFLYEATVFKNVIYLYEPLNDPEAIGLLNMIVTLLSQWIRDIKRMKGTNFYYEGYRLFQGAYVDIITRLKNNGFYEEEEVRIAYVPRKHLGNNFQKYLASEALEFAKKSEVVASTKLVKPILGEKKKYIDMFSWLNEHQLKLPIKRIIVGPGEDKIERENKLRTLLESLNLAIPVTVSNIPLRKQKK